MSSDHPKSSKRTVLSLPEFFRFMNLALRPRDFLTSEERRELASLVRRLLARKPTPRLKK
jgi:hypothetical protein